MKILPLLFVALVALVWWLRRRSRRVRHAHAPVARELAGADDAGGGIGQKCGVRRAQALGRDAGIGVEEQDDPGLPLRRAAVAGPGEAEILARANHDGPVREGRQIIGRAVRRAVVDHHDMQREGVTELRLRRGEAREAGAHEAAAVPVDDHDVDRRGGERGGGAHGRVSGVAGRSRGGPRRPASPSRRASARRRRTRGRKPESAQ